MTQRLHRAHRIFSIAMIAVGFTIAISSLSVVRAEHAKPDKSKKYSCSGGTACVEGDSTGSSTYGVYGVGSAADGVRGVTTSSGGGNGVIGLAEGTSTTANGVYGGSTNANGVNGVSTNADGVYGNGFTGVYGYSENGYAGYFESDCHCDYVLYAVADNQSGSSPYLFGALDYPNEQEFYVDYKADGVFDGSVTATSFNTDQPARGGPKLEAFSPESTRATIEDTGTARLDGGEGAVRFDSAFASTIEAARGYQVFLTPNGETRGWLYVAAKYEGGFIVREAEHGRSSIYFDYRVVAHPYGASEARLPQLDLKRPPIPHLVKHVPPQQP